MSRRSTAFEPRIRRQIWLKQLPNSRLIHQWSGLIAAIGVLMWTLSGLLHPLMSRQNPQPLTQRPFLVQQANDPSKASVAAPHELSSRLSSQLPNPSDWLRQAGLTQAHSVRWLYHAGQPLLQVQVTPHEPARYWRIDGTEQRDYDATLAQQIAQHYVGKDFAIRNVQHITHFTDDYVSVNQLLPVWQITFDHPNGLRAYVDTQTPRLGALVDDTKRRNQNFFRALHTGSWMPSEAARVGLMTVFLMAGFTSALTGLWYYTVRWQLGSLSTQHAAQQQRSARWHRGLGLAVSVFLLSWTISGTWHLWHQSLVEQRPATQQRGAMLSAPLPISALTAVQLPNDVTTWRTLNAVQLQSSASSGVVWQVDMPSASMSASASTKNTPPQDEHSHHAKGTPPPPSPSASQRSSGLRYWSNSTQQWIANADQTYAQQLANQSSIASTTSLQVEKITTLITTFKGEYGFINKRLPVWRVYDSETQTARYVETSTGRLALETHQSDRIEGLIFANFHKWHFIGDWLNKDWRDSLQALGAALVMLLTVLGVWLYVRRRF
jgi:hypothetical protein